MTFGGQCDFLSDLNPMVWYGKFETETASIDSSDNFGSRALEYLADRVTAAQLTLLKLTKNSSLMKNLALVTFSSSFGSRLAAIKKQYQ